MVNGGIEIKCKNNEDLTKAHEKAKKEMAEDYNIQLSYRKLVILKFV